MKRVVSPVPCRQAGRFRLEWLGRLVFALLLAVLVLAALQQIIFGIVEAQALNPVPAGTARPDDHDAPSQRLAFASGGRQLQASFVPVPEPAAPALAIFHGDEEDLSRWAAVQAHLHAAGIASFVFDYSGYGDSSGKPSVAHLREDARAAWQRFVADTPRTVRRLALGFSLGSGPLLEVAPSLQPAPAALVLVGGFASARDTAVALGYVPAWAAWALPDLWHNERAIGLVGLPVLIAHSRGDELIPFGDALRLCRAGGGPRRLLPLEGLTHDAPMQPEASAALWSAVLALARGQGLGSVVAAHETCA